MKVLLFNIALFLISFSFAESRCDWYGLAPASPRKIFYSKAYGNIPFLDNQKPVMNPLLKNLQIHLRSFSETHVTGYSGKLFEPLED